MIGRKFVSPEIMDLNIMHMIRMTEIVKDAMMLGGQGIEYSYFRCTEHTPGPGAATRAELGSYG